MSALLWLAITTHRHPCPQPVAREPRVPNLLSPHRDHRCDPACTAVPGWLPLLQTSRAQPLGPPASPSVPTISWQEPCWLGRKGPANRTATIWGMELTSTLWSSDPHVVCAGRARAEVVFFFFFSCSSFFKDGYWLESLCICLELDGQTSASLWGWGGAPATNQTLFPVLFLFSKTDKPDGGAAPLLGGVTWLPRPRPMATFVSCPEDTDFFVHLHPPRAHPPL